MGACPGSCRAAMAVAADMAADTAIRCLAGMPRKCRRLLPALLRHAFYCRLGAPPAAPAPGQTPDGKPAVRVVANPLDNALIIQATPEQYQEILRILKDLDVPPRQILLEAKIYSVRSQRILRGRSFGPVPACERRGPRAAWQFVYFRLRCSRRPHSSSAFWWARAKSFWLSSICRRTKAAPRFSPSPA